MNRLLSLSQKILALVVLTLLSISAYAWRPTYTYSATVQAGLSTSSTGGGLVYVDKEATGYTTVSDSDWSESGSEGGNSSNTQNANLDVYLYAKENPGYKFDGWIIDSQTGTPGDKGTNNGSVWSTVKQFKVGYYYDRDIEYKAYAFFSPKKYEITYDANGGSVSPSTPHEYTIKSTDALRTPTRNGYTFNGWKVTQIDSNEGNWTLNSTASSPLSGKYGNVTLTAQWTLTDYTITYNADGGTLSPSGGSQTYNIESTSTVKSATKTDFALSGWQVTTSDGNWPAVGGTVSASESLTGKYGNVALKALWTPSKADITISVSGLAEGETIMFTVKKDNVTQYTVPVTGKASGSVSVTIKDLPTGSGYSVAPVQGWNFAYDGLNQQDTFGLGASGQTSSFTLTKKSSAKKYDEQSEVNWKL